MELRQLRYFLVLAEELHFAHAADRLQIAQPSLSTQIQALEASLGTKLFLRTQRAVQLTAAGKIFVEEARLTIAQADRAITIGRRAGRGELGTLRIGLALGCTLSGMPSLVMAQYRRLYPEIDLQLTIMSTNRQLDGLRANALDMGFLVLPAIMPEGLESVKLASDPPMIALSADNPLAQRDSLVAADLADEPFLVMNPKASTGIHEHTLLLGEQGNFAPHIARVESDLIVLLSLVGAGFGIVVLSDSVRRINMPNVVYRPLRDFSSSIEFDVVFRRGETGRPIRSFISTCIDYLRDRKGS